MKKLAALLALMMIWPVVAHAQSFVIDPDEIQARQTEAAQKELWDAYKQKHSLPIARNGDLSDDSDSAAPSKSGPSNMLPPGFKAGGPRVSASDAAADYVRDLAEPLSFDDPPPKRREPGLW